MNPSRLVPLVTALLLVSGATLATAGTSSVFVPGAADAWLAGQPDGTIIDDGYPSYDIAPANSPVLASPGLDLTPGTPLTAVVTGTVDYGGCACASPDGSDPCGTFRTGEFFGISMWSGPINALAGVFIDDSIPGGTAPAGLDFSTLAAQAEPVITPLLNQVFFMGDGLTGTGSGSTQQFIVPTGATRLFLGSVDGPGANYNNTEGFNVTLADNVALYRSDVTTLAPHSPPRASVYLVPPTAEDVSITGPVYQYPFTSGDIEQDANALGNGVPLSLYQVNRPIDTLRLAKSGATIRFGF